VLYLFPFIRIVRIRDIKKRTRWEQDYLTAGSVSSLLLHSFCWEQEKLCFEPARAFASESSERRPQANVSLLLLKPFSPTGSPDSSPFRAHLRDYWFWLIFISAVSESSHEVTATQGRS